MSLKNSHLSPESIGCEDWLFDRSLCQDYSNIKAYEKKADFYFDVEDRFMLLPYTLRERYNNDPMQFFEDRKEINSFYHDIDERFMLLPSHLRKSYNSDLVPFSEDSKEIDSFHHDVEARFMLLPCSLRERYDIDFVPFFADPLYPRYNDNLVQFLEDRDEIDSFYHDVNERFTLLPATIRESYNNDPMQLMDTFDTL